eukprot:TRINITY_DN57154_c0_g1_i1.p1 TRINITY_DN57154_c0_g1~~TRINITY_DN57154_c0_g1_i1.p1  ORF type:complete len:300 (-),score=61.14 TRINITY_DN57154_c0_g1_i1:85-984(-)
MADDELVIPIEKQFWPRGVLRGLNPLFRELGDKNGNIVIAASPNKHIMMKGPADKINSAKPGLRALIEEHFPDAPIPGELDDKEPPAPNATVSKPAEAAKEPKQPKTEAAPAGGAGAIRKAISAVVGSSPTPAAKNAASGEKPAEQASKRRKGPRTADGPPSDLVWHCMRKNSSFIRKPVRQLGMRPFSAEPTNLLGVHAARFSGLAADKGVDLRPKKEGIKESVVLLKKSFRRSRPTKSTVSLGISKCPRKGLGVLSSELRSKFYGVTLSGLAEKKYEKVLKSFKKKKAVVKSRRAKS